MDFMTAAKTGFGKISDMNGKASRSEFWWYVLAVVLVGIVISIVLNMVVGPFLASAIWQIVAIILLLAATVRRLADAGKPAFWAYIFFGLGLLSAVIMVVPGLAMLTPILGIASLVLLVIMIYFLVQPSV